MKIYIAGPFFNEEQLNFIKDIEDKLDYLGVEYFSPRKFGIIKDMDEDEKKRRMRQIYLKNVDEMESSTVLLAFVDGYDAGTMFEVGYFTSLRDSEFQSCIFDRYTFTITKENKKVNVMLKESVNGHLTSVDQIESIIQIVNGKEHNKMFFDISNFSEEVE